MPIVPSVPNDVKIVSQVGSSRWVNMSFVSVLARSRMGFFLRGHRYGAGHGVSDGKVSG